jgi:hypothetical protein
MPMLAHDRAEEQRLHTVDGVETELRAQRGIASRSVHEPRIKAMPPLLTEAAVAAQNPVREAFVIWPAANAIGNGGIIGNIICLRSIRVVAKLLTIAGDIE